jgi:hypothetical protein
VFPIENLNVYGAGANLVPYSGYIEVELSTGSGWSCQTPILVVNDEPYDTDVSVVVGTNVVIPYYNHDDKPSDLSPAWKIAFQSGVVKSTRIECIPPWTKVVVKGITRAAAGVNYHSITGITEPFVQQALPGGLIITPSVVKVGGRASTYRIAVEISNVSNKQLFIPSKFPLCELHKVECMPSNKVKDLSIEDLSDDLMSQFSLPDHPEHKAALYSLVSKWKHVFSWNNLECGHTLEVKHRIELTDETPVKMRYRRIAPSMYNEVRQHLNDLLQAGHIRPSKSPWSFPLVLIRKRDNSLRLCVDYRTLNKRTIRDS